jgi:YrbI family 3-deoxy-D-manno-octulosonate 8-phosphate phosphatase
MNDDLMLRLAHIRIVAMDIDGTFTDGTLYYDASGNVMKGFFTGDGLGMELLRRAGIIRGFITGRVDVATEARARYLMADFLLTGIGNKAEALQSISVKYGIPLSDILFIGDDLNDYTGFEAAGVSVAVGNAAMEVKMIADYVTRAGAAAARCARWWTCSSGRRELIRSRSGRRKRIHRWDSGERCQKCIRRVRKKRSQESHCRVKCSFGTS